VFFVVFPKGVARKKGNALVLLNSDPPVTDLLDVDVFGNRTTVPAAFRFDIFSGKSQLTARKSSSTCATLILPTRVGHSPEGRCRNRGTERAPITAR